MTFVVVPVSPLGTVTRRVGRRFPVLRKDETHVIEVVDTLGFGTFSLRESGVVPGL